MRHITLLIPDLLPPPAAVTETDLPDCGTLTRLLARADRLSCHSDYYRLLFDLFGMQPPVNTDWPVAPISFLADTGSSPGYCLRADPVHLSPGREGMVLLDNSMIGLQADEAESLAAELRPWINDLGAELHAPHPARWYLTFQEPPRMQTIPLPEVTGRTIAGCLPTGPEQTRWRQLLNELQMVLHDSPINHEREKRGLHTVNSLWFWGGGQLPQVGHSPFDSCIGDDPFVRGLALLHGLPAAPMPGSAEELLQQSADSGAVLVADNRARQCRAYDNVAGWLAYLDGLEREWIQPLDRQLGRGQLKQLEIVTGGKRFFCRRSQQWRFWRRGSLLSV